MIRLTQLAGALACALVLTIAAAPADGTTISSR